MSPEQIETFIQRLNTMFNKPDLTIADEIFARHFVGHVPMMPILSRSGFMSFVEGLYAAFPDLRQDIHDCIMTHDRVVLRVTYHGTQLGDFMGIPATGCAVKIPAISIFRIANGLIVENWMEMDIFGVVCQISNITPFAFDNHMQSVN